MIARAAVFDDRGRQIGTVESRSLGRHQATFWQAQGLDGCDLGTFARRVDAEDAVWDDWIDGMPRSPRARSEKFRQIVEGRETAPVLVRPEYAR